MKSLSLLEQAENAKSQWQNEPAWLQKIREQAWQAFEERGFPTAKTENWKYTKLRALLGQRFEPSVIASIMTESYLSSLRAKRSNPLLESPKLDCHVASFLATTTANQIVFINGFFNPALSKITNPEITIQNFAEIFKQDNLSPLFSQYFTQSADLNSPGFTTLNTLLMQDGAYVHIPANTLIEEPIQLVFINTGCEIASHLRNLIVLGENAKASVVEYYYSVIASEAKQSSLYNSDKSLDCHVAPLLAMTPSHYFTNTVTEIILEAKAKLHYYKIQQEGLAATHIHSLYARQAEHSQFHSVNIDQGSKLTRNWLQSKLEGIEAYSEFSGLYIAKGNQYIDNHTRVEHLSPHTTSQELYKGVLNDNAQAVFNGQVFIALGAAKSDASQSNRNLLLSDKAEIDTKPQLEIYTDDVKCSHGATVADLSEDALFYLRTRGIPIENAKALLLEGFMQEIWEKVLFMASHHRTTT
jgi:Fe-S cluster assembly protein SufD